VRLDELRTRATISVEEAAEVVGISRATAYAAAREGTLPVLRFGRCLRVPMGQLLRMLSLESNEGVALTTPSETDVSPMPSRASERKNDGGHLTAVDSKTAGP
jgi:excisionase family DNA binding protein